MYLGPHDAFSQIAQLDGASKALPFLQREEWAGRYVHILNVQRAIDLALGIFRFECHGQHKVVVLATDDIDSSDFPGALQQCFSNPTSRRVLAVRRNLTHLSGGEVARNPLFDTAATSHFDFVDLFVKNEAWEIPLSVQLSNQSDSQREWARDVFDQAMRVAVAVAALKPWGLPLVIARSVADALSPLLEKVSLDWPAEPLLLRKVSELPSNLRLDIMGWDWRSLVSKLLPSHHFLIHELAMLCGTFKPMARLTA